MDGMCTGADRVARKDDQLVSRHIAGETIIVPIRGKLADLQRIYALDPVAEYIWEQLDGETSLQEVLERILETFDVEREQAKADLAAFVGELLEEGLVEGAS
jgi:hypothetical protein